jgi:protein Tex
VHISQLSNSYVSDPATVVKLQQKVKVTVTEVDIARKRIALSMKDQQPQSRSAAKPNAPKPAVPNNPFQSKLEELKKKFKD